MTVAQRLKILHDEDGPYLPGHHDVAYDLGTPRQFTARGGWNVVCECGVVFAESGDVEDFEARWLAHLRDVGTVPVEPIGWLEEPGVLARLVLWVRGVGHCGKPGRRA